MAICGARCFAGGRRGSFCDLAGDVGVSSFLLFFCERVGNWCIPVGLRLVRVAGFLGGDGLLFRSLVVWPAVVDIVFLFHLVKVTADSRSAESTRLVAYQAVDLAASPRFGVPWRDGRRIWRFQAVKVMNGMPEMKRKMNSSHRGSFVIFLFFGVLFVKGRMYYPIA